jgi:cytochrome o ubiquinol oxidase subunit 2
MKPHGDIAEQQAQLIVTSTLLMLLIIVPVIVLTASSPPVPRLEHPGHLHAGLGPFDQAGTGDLGRAAADHHRAGRHHLDQHAQAGPVPARWTASTRSARTRRHEAPGGARGRDGLEMAVRLSASRASPPSTSWPLPVDRPVEFRMTSSTVMNAFYVPAMAGMVYAMPGMQTQAARRDEPPGTYEGCPPTTAAPASPTCASSVLGLAEGDFASWVESTTARAARR